MHCQLDELLVQQAALFVEVEYDLSYTRLVKTAISIPAPLFEAADRLAKRLGIPRSRLYCHAIERYVSESQKHDVTVLLNKVYEHEKSDLDSELAALQSASISREPW